MKTLTQPTLKNLTGIVATISTPKGLIHIYESVDSGKVITRSKIDTWTGVLHPGIIIGKDKFGRVWVAHNHFKNQRPTFDLLETYLDGEQRLEDIRQVSYSRHQIVDRAIAEVLRGKKYTWTNYNCQVFVNIVVRNEHKSESVDNLSNGAIGGGLLIAATGVASKSPWLALLGGAIAIAGAIAKADSRDKL
jgi:hypothetical protein